MAEPHLPLPFRIGVEHAQRLRQQLRASSVVVLAYFPDYSAGMATSGDHDVDKERAAAAGQRALEAVGWGMLAGDELTEDYRDPSKPVQYPAPQYQHGQYVLLKTGEQGTVDKAFANGYGDGEPTYTIDVTGSYGWAGFEKQGVRERDIEGLCASDDEDLPQPPEP